MTHIENSELNSLSHGDLFGLIEMGQAAGLEDQVLRRLKETDPRVMNPGVEGYDENKIAIDALRNGSAHADYFYALALYDQASKQLQQDPDGDPDENREKVMMLNRYQKFLHHFEARLPQDEDSD